MKLLILFYSSNCTPGRPRQTQNQGMEFFPKLQCEKTKTVDSIHMSGFFAIGNPNGIRNGDE